MITVQIEYTFEEYILDEWLQDHPEYEPDDSEEYMSYFIEDETGITPDGVRML